MRFQQKPYSCGAAAIVNALRCFGKRVPERLVRIRAGTTKKDGTQEIPMRVALKTFGFTSTSFECKKVRNALENIQIALGQGYPIVICVQKDQHWVTVVGMIGNRFIVIDPARTAYNKEENGIRLMTQKQLTKFWRNKEKKFSGFTVEN